MSSLIVFDRCPMLAMQLRPPAQRGRFVLAGVMAFARQRLPTDAQGTMTLTLTNVAVGSRYRIERIGDGSLATPASAAEGVAASGTVALTLDYYPSGNASNDVRIAVRKASAPPKYQPFETQTTLGAAAQFIYVAQVADPIS